MGSQHFRNARKSAEQVSSATVWDGTLEKKWDGSDMSSFTGEKAGYYHIYIYISMCTYVHIFAWIVSVSLQIEV